MTQICLSDLVIEIRRRIRFHEEMAKHPGSGRSGKMKEGIRARELASLMEWINKESKVNVPDTDEKPLGR
jgi:hypothetical protein